MKRITLVIPEHVFDILQKLFVIRTQHESFRDDLVDRFVGGIFRELSDKDSASLTFKVADPKHHQIVAAETNLQHLLTRFNK
jgi:hypothetical protein